MKLTRRSLLAMLALAAADPERLIWRPGRKLISIPAPAPAPVFELFRTKISANSMLFGRELMALIYRRHDGSFVAVNDSHHCDIHDFDAIQSTLAHIRHTAPPWPRVYSRTDFHPRPTRLWEAVPVLSPPLRFRTRA